MNDSDQLKRLFSWSRKIINTRASWVGSTTRLTRSNASIFIRRAPYSMNETSIVLDVKSSLCVSYRSERCHHLINFMRSKRNSRLVYNWLRDNFRMKYGNSSTENIGITIELYNNNSRLFFSWKRCLNFEKQSILILKFWTKKETFSKEK